MRRAVSLIEVLVVIGIVCTLLAIGLPVIASTKESASKTTCRSQLRQIYVSIALYRTEYSGDGVYGDPSRMGLPPSSVPIWTSLPISSQLKCKGPAPAYGNWAPPAYSFRWIPSDDWVPYSSKFESSSIILADYNHNAPGHPSFGGPHISTFGIGVNLEGSVVSKKKKGLWDVLSWWHDDSS